MTLAEQAEQAAAFEAWATSQGYEVKSRKPDGRYWSSHTHGVWEAWQAALREREGAQQARQVPQEAKSLTDAYAEGRGDQYEDDCRVVRLLFENLDDVDELGDGHINTTRVRELLSHFAAAPEAPAPKMWQSHGANNTMRHPEECDLFDGSERAEAPAQPEQGEREAFGTAELDDLAKLHKRTTQGRWGQGATSHNTVAKRDGQPDYRIADFRHADDASFVDAAHRFMPQLIALARASGAQAKKPMTPEQVKATMAAIGYDKDSPRAQADFVNGIRHAEAHHGITGEGA